MTSGPLTLLDKQILTIYIMPPASCKKNGSQRENRQIETGRKRANYHITALWASVTAFWASVTSLWASVTALWASVTALWASVTAIWASVTAQAARNARSAAAEVGGKEGWF